MPIRPLRTAVTALVVVLTAVPSAAAEAAPAGPRVSIVGASVSAGFIDTLLTGGDISNDSLPLEAVARAWWPNATITARPNVFMFKGPERFGKPQIDGALKDRPDVVLAVDFMFWFGYGSYHTPQRRLDVQQRGFALLERLGARVPIVLGDYPDMRGASRRMLPTAMIPDAATLRELNRRLHAWAAKRNNVTLFPLARWVASAKRGGYDVALPACRVRTTAAQLLQKDRLHASRLGVLALGIELQAVMPRSVLPRRLTTATLAQRMSVLADLRHAASATGSCPASALATPR